MIQITDASIADLPAITDLLNAEVRGGTALWTEQELPAEDRASWLADRLDRFALLVARTPEFAGFATYGSFRDKDGYRLTVEHSVYVTPSHRGQGIARALMAPLIERARSQGLHAMIGAVETGNTASLALHKSMGFEQVGTLPQVGIKFGKWLDLTLVQLLLDHAPANGR